MYIMFFNILSTLTQDSTHTSYVSLVGIGKTQSDNGSTKEIPSET